MVVHDSVYIMIAHVRKSHIIQHVIKRVLPDSIAKEMGIEPGDKLISINENEVEDVFNILGLYQLTHIRRLPCQISN